MVYFSPIDTHTAAAHPLSSSYKVVPSIPAYKALIFPSSLALPSPHQLRHIRVLTVRPPFGTLIIRKVKRFEMRDWKHQMEPLPFFLLIHQNHNPFPNSEALAFGATRKEIDMHHEEGIIGMVRIYDMVIRGGLTGEDREDRFAQQGKYAWRIDSQLPLLKAITGIKGDLKPAETSEAIRQELYCQLLVIPHD
jgi:hypothetical protein